MRPMVSNDFDHRLRLWRVDVWLIFVVAVSVRLLLLKEVVAHVCLEKLWILVPDSVHYVDMAWDMVRGTDHASFFLTTWPPGYPAFLAPLLMIFGGPSIVPTLVQILLSSVSAVLLYVFALRLTGRRLIALLSGLLLALSSTSISLSVMLLSDTLFVFLLLAGFLLFIHALQTGQWKYFVFSGFLSGYAILVRAIGEFWPVVMLMIALLFAFTLTAARSHSIHETGKSIMAKALVCVGIVVAIEGSWMVRNYYAHGMFFLTTVDSGGLANVAAFRYERADGEFYRDVRARWQAAYAQEHNLKGLSPEAARKADLEAAITALKQHPGQVLQAYMALVWENLIAVNQSYRILLPEFRSTAERIEWAYLIKRLNYLSVILSLAGFLILIVRRSYATATVLGLTFLYFALTIGVTRWQGSRLFFPGQIAALPLISVSLVAMFDLVWNMSKKALSALQLIYSGR